MDIVVIGGTGHIGTYLVPRLVRAGHRVTVLSRGEAKPYQADAAWDSVRLITVDRAAEDEAGIFARRVADLGADTVIDLVCFTPESAAQLVEGLRDRTGHLIHCGSIWMHGKSLRVPIEEDDLAGPDAGSPFGDYGIRKAAIAKLLREETRAGGLVTTSVHPGHISGPGWAPVGPLGNLDPQVWQALSAGRELSMPGLGTELLSHVHADDVAQVFQLAAENREAARGQSFHATAGSALTVRGFAELAAGWFGQSPRLRSVSWETFRTATAPEYAEQSWEHLARSQHVSIEKARTVLGYSPAFPPEEAARAGVAALIANGALEVDRPMIESVPAGAVQR